MRQNTLSHQPQDEIVCERKMLLSSLGSIAYCGGLTLLLFLGKLALAAAVGAVAYYAFDTNSETALIIGVVAYLMTAFFIGTLELFGSYRMKD